MAPSKKEIQIVKMNPPQLREEEAVVDSKVPKETTVPLAVQPKNIRDTAEISTPHSKKKQVIYEVKDFLIHPSLDSVDIVNKTQLPSNFTKYTALI